jgi:hypothetical protein
VFVEAVAQSVEQRTFKRFPANLSKSEKCRFTWENKAFSDEGPVVQKRSKTDDIG